MKKNTVRSMIADNIPKKEMYIFIMTYHAVKKKKKKKKKE